MCVVLGRFVPRQLKTAALAYFVEHVCRHPVLRSAEVFKFFLSVDNLKEKKVEERLFSQRAAGLSVRCICVQKWKAGKRQFEKDPMVGAMFYRSVSCPCNPKVGRRVLYWRVVVWYFCCMRCTFSARSVRSVRCFARWLVDVALLCLFVCVCCVKARAAPEQQRRAREGHRLRGPQQHPRRARARSAH